MHVSALLCSTKAKVKSLFGIEGSKIKNKKPTTFAVFTSYPDASCTLTGFTYSTPSRPSTAAVAPYVA